MTEVAMLYYLDNVTQESIAKRLSLSRVKVSRLLKRARDEGIVEVRVLQHPTVSNELEQALRERFRLDRALIALDHADPDTQRAAVASLVANYLNKTLADGMIVAVGMGRNVGAVADNVFLPTSRDCTFVCAIGGSLRAGEYMNPDHICRRLAARFGGESESLYAPAMVANPELRSLLLANDTVRATLDRARRADLALIGIGDMSEDSNLVRMGWFSPQEIAQARLSGTVGDLMGYDFIDIHGRPAVNALQERVIGLTRQDLVRIPDVIAIASENTKAAAILGALRSETINTLATTVTNAHTILALDGAAM
ncbi:sugar-binding domain-containing protein [Azotobacter vinelandii CA]|uniref:Sugar-binding domain-containing protein n=3 Tax=Azotobacter group TaxID=351 RepID=C1DG97_AZOVD|nr:sugar-binding domain-containing protein [Azotobacter vinelandii DJ]AGK15027.1 sugar-binding domain-containing protein [Azotobacter vinelandii CA]AGK20482.1 sugar-binding domain-containing protein [Azotobacter vinelandii CA6]GLK61989.1 DNA-binding protein [Azotobacter vinelandii]